MNHNQRNNSPPYHRRCLRGGSAAGVATGAVLAAALSPVATASATGDATPDVGGIVIFPDNDPFADLAGAIDPNAFLANGILDSNIPTDPLGVFANDLDNALPAPLGMDLDQFVDLFVPATGTGLLGGLGGLGGLGELLGGLGGDLGSLLSGLGL